MAEIRQLQLIEMNEAVRLTDLVFRDHEHVSMGEAFPFVFSPSLGQSFGAFEDSKLVSFIGIVPWLIYVGRAQLKVYALGAVCTHPDYRGKGYASTLLEHVYHHVRQAQASLLLVSGDRSLYTRNQCYPFGSFNRYSVKPEHCASLVAQNAMVGYTFRERTSADWYTLHELAASRTVRYDQSLSELALLIHSQAVASNSKLEHRTLIAEKDGKVLSFAVVAVPGKYMPLGAPQAIEWAGDVEAVVALLAYAVERYSLHQLDIAVAWHEIGLQEALRNVEFQASHNNGTICITDPQLLLDQLEPYLKDVIDLQQDKMTVTPSADGRSVLRFGPETIDLAPQELVSLLFDTEPQLAMKLQEGLSSLFPIPFPYVGGLNFV
ncbi:acetyltransferase [Paenibacillus baekrokdamisoli]|uniref:Acetyltransferase n=1 Tax=Paenibacillus baekrokdamisoli TaxID=1712516 RepID=A0A3G9J620_9BACL|nr:GNAT family N-acetyltransferase [Paenibacillus baekrokdamisoli]MBB3069223.1 putative N-acetyltransferase YhbS [Paenibacillus baekrokdamisoli]BBH18804.1 acetyltransferase [Paenibacillus baekrokdamisoli]